MASFDRRHFLQAAALTAVQAVAQTPPPAKMRLGIILGTSPPIPMPPSAGFTSSGSPPARSASGRRTTLPPPLSARPSNSMASRPTSAVFGGPGLEIYDFYQGPLTIGLVPTKTRQARIARVKEVSDFAKKAGIDAVQGHCGFIPENPNDALYTEAVEAIRAAAQHAKQNGQKFLCETGQETPITMVRAIRDVGLDNVGVNFDAANLILYGKANPVDAVDVLAPYIQGVHAKDGLYPADPRKLGKEVAIGQGKVDFPALVEKLKKIGYRNPLTIEREIRGERQTADILAAKAFLEKLIG